MSKIDAESYYDYEQFDSESTDDNNVEETKNESKVKSFSDFVLMTESQRNPVGPGEPGAFIPYEEALALRELGFDEPCFGYFNTSNNELFIDNSNNRTGNVDNRWCSAPLWEQAFRWFREKHELDSWVYRPDEKLNIWGYNTTLHTNVSPFKSYEEAELECLKQLIKIVTKEWLKK